jgi:hypothetical protein
MTSTVLAKVRAIAIRGLAVMAVLLTYAVSSVGTQVLSVVGVSTLALATSSTPAAAPWRRRYRRRRWAPVRRYRRGYRRRWW